ncbi:MAG: 16S rRNA (guanine(527)-N(7))-methyltransferase RsmG [Nitrospirae bacterium]|nr:MAG: 16S rRNA (guanine(527)-N(7))-methyltransferase RsmG [Nitrospirota bacterium]
MRSTLSSGLQQLGIEPKNHVIASFETYLAELKKWNKAYNLTALKKDEEIIIKHFLDSLLYLKLLPENACSVADIGSGAGFPGAPIAIVRPDIAITLVEPSRKKCAFLRNIKRVLQLNNVEILESRVEDIKDVVFDVAVTRALFSLDDFVKKTKQLIKKDGILILNKGPKLDSEIKQLPDTIKYEITEMALPFSEAKRNLIKIHL